MNTEERHLEAADAALNRERDSSIAAIQGVLSRPGEVDCVRCGEPIEAARRNALPSAKRCIGCQTQFEERGSRGY
jgi:phage/conjugal plasmid C-4 type zinc finger TraR family protein